MAPAAAPASSESRAFLQSCSSLPLPSQKCACRSSIRMMIDVWTGVQCSMALNHKMHSFMLIKMSTGRVAAAMRQMMASSA